MQQQRGAVSQNVPRVETACRGAAREMGLAQGEALREKFHAALPILTELEAFRLLKPRWMPRPVHQWIAETKGSRFLSRSLPDTLPQAQSRLLGIVEAAGVSTRSLALWNAMEAVLSNLSRTSVVPTGFGCSAVAVTRRSSRNGRPIIGHNFDFLPIVQPFYTIRSSEPKGKLRSLEFTLAPLGGASDGINEAGLCIALNYAFATDGSRPNPTISMWVAEALASCRTVPEAAEFLAKSKRWGGGLAMLADAEGCIASLELSSTRSALRYPPRDEDRLFHTNRFSQPRMMEVEIHDCAQYSRLAPQALRDRCVHLSSEFRDARFRTRLAEASAWNENDIAELMSDHGPAGQPSADSICMHGGYWYTTACIQLLPQQRTMRVAYDTACCAQFADFDL